LNQHSNNQTKHPNEHELVRLPNAAHSENGFSEFVGTSTIVTQLRNRVVQLAGTNTPVLITGEPGTGKTMIACYLHRSHQGQLAEIDCLVANRQGSDARPHDLVEALASEIIDRQKQLEAAGGGILFLRHIDALPLPIQKILAQFCEQSSAESPAPSRTVRVVCSSQAALVPLIENGSFRDDLFHRLTVFPLVTPALRDHRDDIPALVHARSKRLRETHPRAIQFDADALFAMSRYTWPGNVDELFKLVERKTIQHPNSTIGMRQIVEDLVSNRESQTAETYEDSNEGNESATNLNSLTRVSHLPDEGLDLKEHIAKIEKELIELALIESRDVVARAAKHLRLGRTTLVEKMRRYGLQKHRHDQSLAPEVATKLEKC